MLTLLLVAFFSLRLHTISVQLANNYFTQNKKYIKEKSKLGSTKVKLNGIHSVALCQHVNINETTASKLQITIIPDKQKEINDSKRLNFPLKYTTGRIHTVCITKELHS